MSGEHDRSVLPLGGPVVAGDQAHAVQAMKVAEHEGIAAFRLVRCAIGEREVPGRVLRPTMSLEERVLLGRPWLDVSPPAAHPVLTGVDQVPSLGDSPLFTKYLAMNSVCSRLVPVSAVAAEMGKGRQLAAPPVSRDWPLDVNRN